ncbi:MAG: toxin-antitoxin system TumE family protein [Acetobacteraceae bacterium]
MKKAAEHTLEYLLAFDGRRHWYEGGYYAKFEIRRVPPEKARPHGLKYSFTLHAPDGTRLVGFDNAHAVPPRGSRFKKRTAQVDHWHRTSTDPGRRYAFKDAESLIDNFFDAIERVLTARGISFEVLADDDGAER